MCEPLSGEWVRRGWGDGQEDSVRGGHVEMGGWGRDEMVVVSAEV